MATGEVTPLQVGDEDFVVASMIERCPKTMMLRELMMNAIEAARSAPEGNKIVQISAAENAGVPKLVMWNTGPGMDANELLAICDIASSLGKEMSLSGNFGMGAKVASLPSNKLGMRYRSCKSGRVHEVILCNRGGTYGRLRRLDPETDEYHEVIDVTGIVSREGRPLDHDWTEVMLLGNRQDQDTAKDPYNGDPPQDTQWLATYLYHRFYRLPDGVKVTLLKGTNKLDGNRQFESIPQRLRYFERHETVSLVTGAKVHYLYDAPYEKETGTGHNRSVKGATASDVSTCAIIYKDEMYDLHRGRAWTFDAPIFGVPFGAKHISIHIELPDNFAALPEAYRQFLRYEGGEQHQVKTTDFAALVRDHRPQWLIDLIKSLAPDNASTDDIRDELQKLLNSLRVQRSSPKLEDSGPIAVASGAGPAAGYGRGFEDGGGQSFRPRPADLSVVPTGARRAMVMTNLERAPEIILLREDSQIEEKRLKGRAARYYLESSTLFINTQYSAVGEMRRQLESEYAAAPDLELMRSLAVQIAERAMILRAGRTVVYALAKQLNREWTRSDVDIALSPESLSMSADDFADALQNARRAIGKALRVTRQVAPLEMASV